jgi:hypothetical protein
MKLILNPVNLVTKIIIIILTNSGGKTGAKISRPAKRIKHQGNYLVAPILTSGGGGKRHLGQKIFLTNRY